MDGTTPNWMDMFTDGRDFDDVFDTTGHHTGIEDAIVHVRKGSEEVVVSLPATTANCS